MTKPLQTELAAALNVDPSLVTRYKSRGMPIHNIEAAIAWKAVNVQARVSARSSAGVAPVEGGSSSTHPTEPIGPGTASAHVHHDEYAASRARRERADAERAEIEVARMAGRLVDREQVTAAVFDAFRALRDRLMAVPAGARPAWSAWARCARSSC